MIWGRGIRISGSGAAIVVLALAIPSSAAAQSWYLDWLKRVEEWSMEKDYRGWILHGLIAAAVTGAADLVIGRPEYGAAVSSGFYIGKEIREARMWDGFTTDRIMDLATPVVAAVVTAYVLRDRPARLEPPRILPPLPVPCAPVPARSARLPGPRMRTPGPWQCLAAARAPALFLAARS